MRSPSKLALPFLVLFAIGSFGCSKPEDKFVGHYEGKVVLAKSLQDQMDKLPPAMAANAKKQLEQLKFTLDLRKDKTYTVNATIPMKGNDVSEGTWTLADNKITCTGKTETVDGKPVPNPDTKSETLTVGSDPKVLTADMSSNPQAAQYGSMTFTKTD